MGKQLFTLPGGGLKLHFRKRPHSLSYSLIDQRGPCRRYGCEGKAGFMWSPGKGVPFRPLASDAGDDGRMAQADPEREPPDDDPPPAASPPRAPRGIDPDAWARADERERKRLARNARG